MRTLYCIALLGFLVGLITVVLVYGPSRDTAYAMSNLYQAELSGGSLVGAGDGPHYGPPWDADAHLSASFATTTPTPVPSPTATPIPVSLIEDASLGEALQIIAEATIEEAVLLLEEMSTQKAADMMGQMGPIEAAEMLSEVAPAKAGAIMEEIFIDKMVEIVDLMPEDKLVERLPEMSPDKLWGVPLQSLMDKLPSVPVMHLDFWIRPEVDPELPQPESEEPREDLTVYTLPEVWESEWALLVGSPSPIDTMWAKFNRTITDVRVSVEVLDQLPAGTPSLPAGQVPNAFLRVNVENAVPEDIAVAAAIVTVDNSWISANQVHKWSIEFDRFDEDLGTWVPFPSKRIREDEERVFFAVIVPSFSTLAIAGSEELAEQVFRVTDLAISPGSPVAGEDITIGARVTNTGPEMAVYPANLWLDHAIEAARTLMVQAGQTVPLTFTTSKPEGTYEVRLERLLGQFTVGPRPQGQVAPPSVGGTALPAAALILLGLMGAALALSGGVLLLRRPR